MFLDGILEHNRSFVRGREPRPLPAAEALRIAVIACYDPRLCEMIPSALGIEPGRAIVLRTAGAWVRPEGDPIRSLALAVFLFGVTEVIVVGHTSCRMASFASASFIESFRGRGVPREAFGPGDLREWAGAISNPRRGVQSSVDAIASAPFLPRDLIVAGLVLDDATGSLEVVVPPASVTARQASSPPQARAEPATSAAVSDATAAAFHAPPELVREVEAIRSFVKALESTAGWREELARLRDEMERQRSALVRLTLVEKFVRRSAANAREVFAAFERLKKETASATRGLGPEVLIDLFRHASGGPLP